VGQALSLSAPCSQRGVPLSAVAFSRWHNDRRAASTQFLRRDNLSYANFKNQKSHRAESAVQTG
jgi:hypothetical protein